MRSSRPDGDSPVVPRVLGALARATWPGGGPGFLPTRKHWIMLVALVGMLVAQPLFVHRSAALDILSDLAFAAIYTYIFLVAFAGPTERSVATALLLAAVACDLGQRAPSPTWRELSTVAFHLILILFLGIVVGVILRDLFRKTVIRGDDVIGAVCGYILGALVWSHLYVLTYLFRPAAFAMSPAIVPQLLDRHMQRTLFDYLSFTTLTGLGFSDMTPAGPPVYSLAWLEVMFGQFYMAIVVAQLVGLKMAQAVRHDTDSPDDG